MTQLNRDAAEAAVAAGVRAATDVTGFGLLGHLYKMCRASGVGAVIDRRRCPCRRGPGSAAGRLRLRRHPAQPRLGAPAPARRRRRHRGRSAAARGCADLRRAARGRRAAGVSGHRAHRRRVRDRSALSRPPACPAVVIESSVMPAGTPGREPPLLRFDGVPRIPSRAKAGLEYPNRVRAEAASKRQPDRPRATGRCRPPNSVPNPPATANRSLHCSMRPGRPGAGVRRPPGPSGAPSPAWPPRHPITPSTASARAGPGLLGRRGDHGKTRPQRGSRNSRRRKADPRARRSRSGVAVSGEQHRGVGRRAGWRTGRPPTPGRPLDRAQHLPQRPQREP